VYFKFGNFLGGIVFSIFDLLALSQIPGIGANRLRALVSYFGDPSSVLHASAKEISVVDGFSKKFASAIIHSIKSKEFDEAKHYAERQLSKLNKAEAQIVSYWDSSYPDMLKKIYDPPAYLFVKGKFIESDRFSIAIVGTRTPSSYGVAMAEEFSGSLTRIGISIVSGLARGIDTVAHSSTLKAGGRTIAVIGSGLDVIYPPENRLLFENIPHDGVIVSEYAMGAKPDAVNFPKRNRIISGLSLGTLVIETDINGGAMITANTALDQNREVFALPGNVTLKKSRGCNALIKDGRAKLVENVDDILLELSSQLRPILKTSKKDHEPLPELTLFEKNLFDIIGEEPCHIDAIAESAGITTADALVTLLGLEFKGVIKQLPGKMFIRK
jgi:DNA processing protein